MDGLFGIFGDLSGFLEAKARAEKETNKRFSPAEAYNNAGDAYRHIVWQALLANKFGEGTAKAAGDFHENRFVPIVGAMGHPQAEIDMDLKNNEIGRYIGKDATGVQQILDRAKLINDYNLYHKYKKTR
jgi:hypothetical protein